MYPDVKEMTEIIPTILFKHDLSSRASKNSCEVLGVYELRTLYCTRPSRYCFMEYCIGGETC